MEFKAFCGNTYHAMFLRVVQKAFESGSLSMDDAEQCVLRCVKQRDLEGAERMLRKLITAKLPVRVEVLAAFAEVCVSSMSRNDVFFPVLTAAYESGSVNLAQMKELEAFLVKLSEVGEPFGVQQLMEMYP